MKYFVIFLIIFGVVVSSVHAQYMEPISVIQPEKFSPLENRIGADQTLNVIFELKSQQYAEIPEEHLRITFLEVSEDSRCPADVTCVWAGMVNLKFNISQDQEKEITLSSNNITTVFDKYQIQLIDVKPYPVSTKTIKAEDYIAILKVTKDNDTPNPAPSAILSPLKQFKSGISIDEIQCKDGLELVTKSSDNSPACVRPQSVPILLMRGWSTQENQTILDLSIGQRVGSMLVEEIFSDHVSGLNFMDYPVAREQGFPITLKVGEKASNGCTVEVTLLKINDNTATFLKKEYHDKPCPICLSEDTVIYTPNGQVNIKELHEGMDIFTQDTSGNKYVGTILKTGKTQVSPNHKMIHIVLADNRELYGSPKHPTTDGKVLEELSVGDILDGAKIKILEVVPYDGQYTFDILPSGSTGYYWANGILIKSTLN
jgi:hypothetical protein